MMRTNGEDMQAKKVTKEHCVICGMKASATRQAYHKPSEGVVAYFCGPYTSRACVAHHMVGVPSLCRRGMSGGTSTHLHRPVFQMSRATRRAIARCAYTVRVKLGAIVLWVDEGPDEWGVG
eukprot:scaffold1110_cov399-Pavlova_lutheri.AAC.3